MLLGLVPAQLQRAQLEDLQRDPRPGRALKPGGAGQSRRLGRDHGLAEDCDSGIGRVAQLQITDRSPRSLPVRVGTPEPVSQRPQISDRRSAVGVPAEHLGDKDRLVRHDLIGASARSFLPR